MASGENVQPESPRSGLGYFEAACLVAAAVILAYQLAVPPIVGLADNGDFDKVMRPAGLSHAAESYEDRYFFYVNSKFSFIDLRWSIGGYLTSERLIVITARAIGVLLSGDGLFDIRILGLLQAFILLAGFALLLAATRGLRAVTRAAFGLLLVLMFTDVGYVAALNSFYSQTASLLFLLIAAGLWGLIARQSGPKLAPLVCFFIAAILFVGSKPQETIHAPVLAALLLRASMARSTGRAEKVRGALLAIGLLIFAAVYYARTPESIKEAALYNNVFYELLPASADPSADLAALGADVRLAPLVGTTAYAENSPVNEPEFRSQFFDRVSHRDVAIFYLSRPERLWALLRKSSAGAFALRPPHLGNFEKSAGRPPQTLTGAFGLWSGLRYRALPGSVWTILLLFVGSLAAAIFLRARRNLSLKERLFLEGFCALNVMALASFLTCTLGSSLYDISRHLFAFQAMTDLMLLVAATWLIEVGAKRIIKRQVGTGHG
jgi:hypothetical protein